MRDWQKTDKDFIPEKVTVGKFKGFAFLTCKFNGEKWVSTSVFERLCGFKPHSQRDSSKELKKAVYNAVDVIDNIPTKGFSFVSYGGNVYGTVDYNDNRNVILHDPRGFDFPVTAAEFFDLLRSNGGNMTDNVLDGIECVYAWSSVTQHRYLLPTSSPRYAKVAANSEKLNSKLRNAKYLTKRDFAIGHVYNGDPDKMPGKFMYMGVHDVHSVECQMYAFSRGSYDCFKYASKCSSDISGESRLVFYKLGADAFTDAPYVFKTAFSKLLLSEDGDEDGSSFEMYNSSLKCTYENVKSDMEKSLLFNKIAFPLSGKTMPLSRELFAKTVACAVPLATGRLTSVQAMSDAFSKKNIVWPLTCSAFAYPDVDFLSRHKSAFNSADETKLVRMLIRYGIRYGKCSLHGSVHYTWAASFQTIDTTQQIRSRWSLPQYQLAQSDSIELNQPPTPSDIDRLYERIQPMVNEIVFENGNRMPEEHAMAFTHPNALHMGYCPWQYII